MRSQYRGILSWFRVGVPPKLGKKNPEIFNISLDTLWIWWKKTARLSDATRDTWWRHKCALCKYVKKCDIRTYIQTDVWRNGKLSINALYSSYLPMASNQTIKDRPHQRQWWVGRVSLVSTYLPVLNPGRWKQRNNRPMIPAAVGCVRSTAPNINDTISP